MGRSGPGERLGSLFSPMRGVSPSRPPAFTRGGRRDARCCPPPMANLSRVLREHTVKGEPGRRTPRVPCWSPPRSTPRAPGRPRSLGGWGPWDWPDAPPPPQVQSELRRCWHRRRAGASLRERRHASGPPSEKPLLCGAGGSNGAGRGPPAHPSPVGSRPALAESPF